MPWVLVQAKERNVPLKVMLEGNHSNDSNDALEGIENILGFRDFSRKSLMPLRGSHMTPLKH